MRQTRTYCKICNQLNDTAVMVIIPPAMSVICNPCYENEKEQLRPNDRDIIVLRLTELMEENKRKVTKLMEFEGAYISKWDRAKAATFLEINNLIMAAIYGKAK